MRWALLLCAALAAPAHAAWEWSAAVEVASASGAALFPHLESANRQGIAVSGDTVGVAWEDNRSGSPQCYLALKPGGAARFAAEIRLSLYDYTIAVDGTPWEQTFAGVWEPAFHPGRGSVLAPVRIQGRWGLAENGREIWERRFVQLWQLAFSPNGRRLAAIVAPSFGRWTVAVDGVPWPVTVGEMVTDLVFSPDGARVAAAFKDRGRWSLGADGRLWQTTFDMVGKPVFSADGRHLAAAVQRQGVCTVAVDDRVWTRDCETAWDPEFSPDGTRLLLRTIEGGTYFRRVVPVAAIAAKGGA